VIKIPSSMMNQSWMGSDFTNKDISKSTDIIDQYDHRLLETRQQEAALEKNGVRPSKRHATDSAPIEVKIPEGDKRSEYMKVMCDLTILAFPGLKEAPGMRCPFRVPEPFEFVFQLR